MKFRWNSHVFGACMCESWGRNTRIIAFRSVHIHIHTLTVYFLFRRLANFLHSWAENVISTNKSSPLLLSSKKKEEVWLLPTIFDMLRALVSTKQVRKYFILFYFAITSSMHPHQHDKNISMTLSVAFIHPPRHKLFKWTFHVFSFILHFFLCARLWFIMNKNDRNEYKNGER